MKKNHNLIISGLLSLMIMGCESNKQESKNEENTYESIDTILRRNEENFISISRASEKSDSSITKKVEKTVKQINTLKEEVKQLKEENNELKIKVDDANDVGKPFQLLPVSNGKDNR